MDNRELLAQIGQIIDKRFDEQEKRLGENFDKRFGEQEKRFEEMLDARFAEQDEKMEKRFAKQGEKWDEKFSAFTEEIIGVVNDLYTSHTRQTEILIENTVTKRIDSLYDGYKLTHEKQWEYERKIEAMLDEMEQMELRIRALENRSA